MCLCGGVGDGCVCVVVVMGVFVWWCYNYMVLEKNVYITVLLLETGCAVMKLKEVL